MRAQMTSPKFAGIELHHFKPFQMKEFGGKYSVLKDEYGLTVKASNYPGMKPDEIQLTTFYGDPGIDPHETKTLITGNQSAAAATQELEETASRIPFHPKAPDIWKRRPISETLRSNLQNAIKDAFQKSVLTQKQHDGILEMLSRNETLWENFDANTWATWER